MKKKKLTKCLIINFLRKWSPGPNSFNNFIVMSGKDGKEYCEYSNGKWYISFESSPLYDLFQGYPNWNFHTAFCDFLDGYGYYFEQGHSWNCSIYEQ